MTEVYLFPHNWDVGHIMPKDRQLSDQTLKLLARLVRDFKLNPQPAWTMVNETIQQRLCGPDSASASGRQLVHKNGSNYTPCVIPSDIKAVVRRVEVMRGASSSSSSSPSPSTSATSSSSFPTSAGKAAIEPASRMNLVVGESEDHPESLPLKRKRRGKDQSLKAYDGASSGITRTSVTPASQETSASDGCHCGSSVLRIWPMNKEEPVPIPLLAETVRDIIRVGLVALCEFHKERYQECLVLGIQQQQQLRTGRDTGSLNGAMKSCANKTAAPKNSGAGCLISCIPWAHIAYPQIAWLQIAPSSNCMQSRMQSRLDHETH